MNYETEKIEKLYNEIQKMDKLYNEKKSSYNEEENLYALEVLNMYKKEYETEKKQYADYTAWREKSDREWRSIKSKERYHSIKAKEYREKNKEKLREKRREYYKKNKDKINNKRKENKMKKANNSDSETDSETDSGDNSSDYCPVDMYC